MNLLEKCIALALEAHAGQVDKQGQAYILHPLRVMGQMPTDEEKMAAVLHDVVEDSGKSFADIRALGVPERVVEVVMLLTHDKTTTSYEAYIERLSADPMARRIKLADLEHNMDLRRLNQIQKRDIGRFERYHSAWHYLTGEASSDVD